MHAPPPDADPANVIAAIEAAIPSDAIFPGEAPRSLTPQPFPLSKKQAAELEKLGHRLFLFHQACTRIHQRSVKGKLPAWIAGYLAAGTSAAEAGSGEIPPILSPELILTEHGWSLTGFAAPAPILPLASWLNRAFAPLAGDPIVAGPDWNDLEIVAEHPPALGGGPSADLYFAFLHLRALRDVWRQELRDSQFKRLQAVIPYTWIMDPAPLPPQAVIPRLELNSMRSVAGLPLDLRDRLVLKSADRVLAGRDASDDQWRDAVNDALEQLAASPHVLQEAAVPGTVAHPVWDPEAREAPLRDTNVSLTPFYRTREKTAVLAGVLATLATGDGAPVYAPCAVVS